MSVEQSWERIRSWFAANADEVAERLGGGASEEAIAQVEQAIGLKIPEDLRASYLAQNGVEYGEDELNLIPSTPESFDSMAFCLLPIERVASEWKNVGGVNRRR